MRQAIELRLIAALVIGLSSVAAAQGPGCVNPPPGLIGWWTGDGDATDRVGGRTGVVLGSTSFVEAHVDGGFRFSSVGDAVTFPREEIWRLPGDFTVDAWIRTTTSSAPQNVIGAFSDPGLGQWQYAINTVNALGGATPGALRFLYVGAGGATASSEVFVEAAGIFDGDFHHIAARRSGTTMDLLIDGELVDSAPNEHVIAADPDLEFGRLSFVPSTSFAGDLDEIEIFDRALSDVEVRSIFEAGTAGKCRVDLDGDQVDDSADNCPDDPNPGQEDRDFDGIGDACDPFPDDPVNALAECRADLAEALAELDQCLADPAFVDSDGDGEEDSTDTCADTDPGLDVDDAGCSLEQFCNSVDFSVKGASKLCDELDWKNDEPLMKNSDRDCALDKDGPGPVDDQCVPLGP